MAQSLVQVEDVEADEAREPEPTTTLPGAANADDEAQPLREGPASPAHAQQYKVVARAGATLQAEFGVKSAAVGTIVAPAAT